jgi:molecular chaperone GrpE
VSGRHIDAKAEETDSQAGEGWESLAEESAGTISTSPELEEALREAAEAVEGKSRSAQQGREAAAQRAEGERSAGPREERSPREVELAIDLEATRDRCLRIQADLENFRRRAAKERLEAEQYGHQNLVKDLLTAVDNLDRAIGHARRSEGGDLESLLQGVELVRRDLSGALARHGVAAIEAVGLPFDPALHEAMAQAPDDSVAPNTVVEELQKGYRLRDRLLRPARVIVSRRGGGGGGNGQEAAG